MDMAGNIQDATAFMGTSLVGRRMVQKGPLTGQAGGAGQSPMLGGQVSGGGVAASASLPGRAVAIGLAPDGYVWLAAEPLGGLVLGQEVSPSQGTDLQLGSSTAMALRQDAWVKLELVRLEEAAGYAARRRHLFNPDVEQSRTEPLQLLGRAKDLDGSTSKDHAGDGDVRTLWVDYDEQGERYKRWRDVVKECFTPAFDEKPLEGPLSSLHVLKHTERYGGDPRQWLNLWMRSKHIEQNDRVYHELKVRTDALFFAGDF